MRLATGGAPAYGASDANPSGVDRSRASDGLIAARETRIVAAPRYLPSRSLSGSIRNMPQVSAAPKVPFRIRHPLAPLLRGTRPLHHRRLIARSPPCASHANSARRLSSATTARSRVGRLALLRHPDHPTPTRPSSRYPLSAPSGGHRYVLNSGHLAEWPTLLDSLRWFVPSAASTACSSRAPDRRAFPSVSTAR